LKRFDHRERFDRRFLLNAMYQCIMSDWCIDRFIWIARYIWLNSHKTRSIVLMLVERSISIFLSGHVWLLWSKIGSGYWF